jgi:hypothetical protein
MCESDAIKAAKKYAQAHGLPHKLVRQTVFIPIGDPLHLSWQGDTWLIFLDDLTPRPSGGQDFGGYLIVIDCATGEAEFHRPM